MKKIILFSFTVLISFYMQAQDFKWVRTYDVPHIPPNASMNVIRGMATDAFGNVYTVVSFVGTIDVDPGPLVTNIVATGYNIFVTKLDTNGNLIWWRMLGDSTTDAIPYDIVTDASGNVYISGEAEGQIDFDPGPGVYNLTGNTSDPFIWKLDINGNFVWAYLESSQVLALPEYHLSISAQGRLYNTGRFASTQDFDSGPGVFNLTAAGNQDCFIRKCDLSGNLLWVKRIGKAGGWVETHSMTTDHAGNVYLSGRFPDSTDFDPGPGVSVIGNDFEQNCIVKLDSNGNFVWVKSINGIGPNAAYLMTNVACDNSNNVFISGQFQNKIDADPGVGVDTLISAGDFDMLVVKLDANGNYKWGHNFGSAGIDRCGGLDIDIQGNVYMTGEFTNTVDFDPGGGTFNLTANGNWVFINNLDSGGNFINALGIGGNNCNAEGFEIIADNWGNLYTSGEYYNTVDFDPGVGVFNKVGYDITEPFTLRLGYKIALRIESNFTKNENIILYPNPVTDNLNIKYDLATNKKAVVEIIDILGRVVMNIDLPANTNLITVSMKGLQPGVYSYKCLNDNAMLKTGKMILK